MTASLTRLAATPVRPADRRARAQGADENSIELVREAARISGGPAYLFYAPLIVPDAATATAMRQQPEIAEAFAHFGSVTKAVVGLGSWEAGQSTLYDAMGAEEREELSRCGVIGDISGVFVDAEGTPVEGRISDRMIGIDARQMQAIPEVIAIVYGNAKAPAARAAVRGRSGQRPGHPRVPGADAGRRRMSPGVAGTRRRSRPGGPMPTERAPGGGADRRHGQPGPGRACRRHGAPAVAPHHPVHPRAAAAPGGGRV